MTKWNDEKIIEELKKVIEDIGYFPTSIDLDSIGRNDLSRALYRYGGIRKFKGLLGYGLEQKDPKPYKYWTNENTTKEIELIIREIKQFPSQRKLLSINRQDIVCAIQKNGGINKFRNLLGYHSPKKSTGYWTNGTTYGELQSIINVVGHFPSSNELIKLNKCNLLHAVHRHGGLNKFRDLMGYKPVQNPNGYWTDETIIQELKEIISKTGHFPTKDELSSMNKTTLGVMICRNGGSSKFYRLLGYGSIQEKYKSELHSYCCKRGKSSESIIKNIITNYCSIHNLPPPQLNTKLSKSNIIEFICNTDKKIGIDVTNTGQDRCITKKWIKKQYHLHLDELWIIVFSDSFTDLDYKYWNLSSPSNVKILSVYQFIDELDYSLDEYMKRKIDKYNCCTFHTKEEFMNKDSNINDLQVRLSK